MGRVEKWSEIEDRCYLKDVKKFIQYGIELRFETCKIKETDHVKRLKENRTDFWTGRVSEKTRKYFATNKRIMS